MDITNRRRFLRTTGKAVLLLPLGSFILQACYGYGSGSTNDTPAEPPTTSGSGSTVLYTSSVDDGHSHMYTIALAAFGAGMELDGETTVSDDHAHSVAISVADLQNAAAGQTVMVTTGTTEDHTHVFTLVKVG